MVFTVRGVGVGLWKDEEFTFDRVEFKLPVRFRRSPFYHSLKPYEGNVKIIFGFKVCWKYTLEEGLKGLELLESGCVMYLASWAILNLTHQYFIQLGFTLPS